MRIPRNKYSVGVILFVYLSCWGTITAFYILEGIEEMARGKYHPAWLAGSLALVVFWFYAFPRTLKAMRISRRG